MKKGQVNLNEQLGFNLNRVAILFRRELIRALRDFRVSPEQWQILISVPDNGTLTQKEIGRITLQEAPTLSRTIDKLYQNGWVDRSMDPQDRRATLIKLTAEGKKVRNRLTEKLMEHFDMFLEDFSAQKRNDLRDRLIDLRKVLRDYP